MIEKKEIPKQTGRNLAYRQVLYYGSLSSLAPEKAVDIKYLESLRQFAYKWIARIDTAIYKYYEDHELELDDCPCCKKYTQKISDATFDDNSGLCNSCSKQEDNDVT